MEVIDMLMSSYESKTFKLAPLLARASALEIPILSLCPGTHIKIIWNFLVISSKDIQPEQISSRKISDDRFTVSYSTNSVVGYYTKLKVSSGFSNDCNFRL